MGVNRIYNAITLFFLLATVVAVGVFGVLLAGPPPEPPPTEIVELPTVAQLPTATPTVTASPVPPTLPPTFTPTPTETLSPTPSATFTLTITPSPTITDTPGPTLTPTISPTPSISPTFTPQPTATGPTQTPEPSISPFLFRLREPIVLRPNFANSAACNWQGVGGTVIGLDGQPFTGNLQVRVFNNQVDRTATVGSNTLYGEVAGWEIPLDNQINNRLYFVQLETINGTPVSERFQIQFTANCQANVAIVNFLQQRPI